MSKSVKPTKSAGKTNHGAGSNHDGKETSKPKKQMEEDDDDDDEGKDDDDDY